MNVSKLPQGKKIDAIFGPEQNDSEFTGGAVGYGGVYEIVVDQLAGPMGFYDVAVIRRHNGPDDIVPLHMAEYIRLCKEDAPEEGKGAE